MPVKINKMPEFYMIFARKIYFSPIGGGGGEASALPAPHLLRLCTWPTPPPVKTRRICTNLRNSLWQKWGGHVHPSPSRGDARRPWSDPQFAAMPPIAKLLRHFFSKVTVYFCLFFIDYVGIKASLNQHNILIRLSQRRRYCGRRRLCFCHACRYTPSRDCKRVATPLWR